MDTSIASLTEAMLELTTADGTTQVVQLDPLPFRIGRGATSENNLQLEDRRISRQCLRISLKDSSYLLEDLGQRNGVLVNGDRVEAAVRLRSGDVITFGQVDNLHLVFRAGAAHEALPDLLSRLEEPGRADAGDRSLRNMSLLLEATALLQSSLPFEEVLAAMVDRAVEITDADRGLLLQADASGIPQPLVARRKGATSLRLDDVAPSQTVIAQALEKNQAVIELDVELAGDALREAKSVIQQKLRSVVAIPLHSKARLNTLDTTQHSGPGELMGVLYLDSRRPAAFSTLERQILDALAVEAASVIENAHLLERERERRRMEQEISIAREIQEALLPKGLRTLPYCRTAAANLPCYAVGGDYFDLLEIGPDRLGLVLADVSGKGLPAALLTAMLQGCFAGMSLGCSPTELVNHVNRFVCGRTDMNRFATLFFGVLNANGALEYINAGHHSPLLIRGGEVTEPFPAQDLPLGMLEGTSFTSSTAQLHPGDTLLLFTDGVTEAVNPADEEYGLDRLMDLARTNARAPVEELQQAVLDSVNGFAAGKAQADDMTVLVLRYQIAS